MEDIEIRKKFRELSRKAGWFFLGLLCLPFGTFAIIRILSGHFGIPAAKIGPYFSLLLIVIPGILLVSFWKLKRSFCVGLLIGSACVAAFWGLIMVVNSHIGGRMPSEADGLGDEYILGNRLFNSRKQ